ncbi:MAG: bacterioferritin [Alphaproteobacteria bacterium]|nr:bacterioferritin [Alphaproteobacteria bacterium]
MKGDKTVIEHLNIGLKKELTAINQYFLHSRMLEDWGLTKLAKHEYKESIEEMQHADLFIKRILLLEGLPNLQTLDKLLIGENVQEIIENDLKLEYGGRDAYREAIAVCEKAQDYVSRDLFLKILADEEGHIDHLETTLESIKLQGIQNFVQLNSEPVGEGE